MQRISGKIEWEVFVDPETNYWVGFCESLKLSASATTHSELLNVIGETLQEFFRELQASGRFEQFIKMHDLRAESDIRVGSSNLRGEIDVSWSMRKIHDSEEVLCR